MTSSVNRRGARRPVRALTLTLAMLLAAPWLSACGGSATRHHYTMTYPEPTGRFERPLPFTIRVREVDMPRTYRGTELVFRPDAHEIQFRRSRRWSERPQDMMTKLVSRHLAATGLTREVIEDLRERPPDFVLDVDVKALELVVRGEKDHRAHLALDFALVRYEDEQVVFRHRFDETEAVSTESVRSGVRAMSRLLERAMDGAVEEMAQHFTALPEPQLDAMTGAGGPRTDPTMAEPDTEVLRPSDEGKGHPQMRADDTPIPPGTGAVFLPALSGSDREPLVTVYRSGEAVGEGQMGKRIILEPGRYDVRYGAGTFEQQGSVTVEVADSRTTFVPPSWAALTVRVVDPNFVPLRESYEILNLETREEFGIGFGADELVGEELRPWVLQPGLYKIIKAGGTYRDRENFATVRLVPGEGTLFTLVIDPDTGDFRGAGVVDAEDTGPTTEQKVWTNSALIGGALDFTTSNEVSADNEWSLAGTIFFDAQTRYREGPHMWSTQVDIEEQQQRTKTRDSFENVEDRLFFHTIYTYDVLPWVGPYVRAGVETKLLPRYAEFGDDPRNVTVLDQDGNVVETEADADRFLLGDSFSPLRLEEGAGGNFAVLQTRFVDLTTRLGIGARQDLALGLRDVQSVQGADVTLRELDDSNRVGPEGTVVLLARISRWVSVSSQFDGLLPFDSDQEVEFEWRNQISLRLVSFASLNYRLNMFRDPEFDATDDTVMTQDVQLRFSYVLF